MYELFLLRHGRSLADDENKFEGRYDSPLTDIGKEQAKNTSEYFDRIKIKFDRILTSPLIRAKETAEIINQSRKLPLIEEPLLMEKDNGLLAGETKVNASTRFPLPDFDSPFRYAPQKTGENTVELHSRGGMVLSKIINLGPGCYLLVSHGGLLNSLVRNILGIGYPVDKSGHTFLFKDNGLLHLHYDESRHSWGICSFNHNLKEY
ncbi:MAG: histidine phosphatase family protein [bacterium]|nr:histidine phosphatase family protein [bacterium]